MLSTSFIVFTLMVVERVSQGLILDDAGQTEIINLRSEMAALKATVAALMENINSECSLQCPTGKSVTFMAQLSATLSNPANGHVVVFDDVITNVGNAYNSVHGIFTAPVNGTYTFNLIASAPNGAANHAIHLFIMKNSVRTAYIFLDANTAYWLRRSTDIALHLMEKDEIWVEVADVQDCGQVKQISNGSVNVTGTTYGEKATYTCDPGYHISDIEWKERVCTAEGTWSSQEPSCYIADCSQPPTIINGSWKVTSTLYGGKATASCDTGYTMTGGDESLTCGADGNWSDSQPTCSIVDCGELQQISNGSVTVTGTTYGADATYTCDPGFHISDIEWKERVCTAEGIWSRQEPSCNITDCSQPPTLVHGTWNITSTLYGGIATATCDKGHTMTDGDENRTCGKDENWSGSQPTCSIVDCGDVQQIAKGSVAVSGTTYAEKATYTCDPGFDISDIGWTQRICTADGNWSEEEPSCTLKDCGNAKQIHYGTVTLTGTTYGEKATYSCHPGFHISDVESTEIVCTAEGIWSRQEPSCTIIECSQPPILPHGTWNITSTIYGGKATATCDMGYTMTDGDENRTCGEDEKWSGSQPTCSIVGVKTDDLGGWIKVVIVVGSVVVIVTVVIVSVLSHKRRGTVKQLTQQETHVLDDSNNREAAPRNNENVVHLYDDADVAIYDLPEDDDIYDKPDDGVTYRPAKGGANNDVSSDDVSYDDATTAGLYVGFMPSATKRDYSVLIQK